MAQPTLTFADLRTRTEEFVKLELSKYDAVGPHPPHCRVIGALTCARHACLTTADPSCASSLPSPPPPPPCQSHDYHHIARVRASALSLARESGVVDESDLELVELSALLHDIFDHKYSGSETLGVEMAAKFLREAGFPDERAARVVGIIDMVGFKNELGRLEAAAQGSSAPAIDPLLGFVQDADRLDAIGAIGAARCFTFGGAKGRALYDPDQPPRTDLTKAEYAAGSANPTSVAHFYEKLLKLKDLMKTDAGRRRAQKRHEFMEAFLHQLDEEIAGRA